MTWVVKRWRLEALEQALTIEARASVRAAREASERDERRARRAADRTAADAAAQLEALALLGAELRASVARMRTTGTPRAVSGAPTVAGDEPAVPLAAVRAMRRRPARASMRSSPLDELFRATTAG